MNIMCFYYLIINLKVLLNIKNFFLLIMRALLNIVCNIILNVLHYMTTWCASYVGIKMMFILFPMGLKESLKRIFLHELSPPILTNNFFCISFEKICSIKVLWWCENHFIYIF